MPTIFCQFCRQPLIDGGCNNHPNVEVTFWQDSITMITPPLRQLTPSYKVVWYTNINMLFLYHWKKSQVIGTLLMQLHDYPIFPPEHFHHHLQRLLSLKAFY